VAPQGIEIRLIHHRLSYAWEGVIGNSSGAFGGPQLHRAFLPPTSILIQGDRAIYAVGYNEGQPGLHGFALSAPQNDTRPLPSTDPFVSYAMITADATRLYWANTGGLSHSSFIGVFDLDTARIATFSAGKPVCLNYRPNSTTCYPGHSYASVIDLHTEAVDAPTGLAVQRNGRVLAVAHGGRNLIRLYDKTSGALLREMSVQLNAKSLNQLAMSSGGDLWVASGQSVLRYTDLESSPRITATINGLTRPLALAATPGGDDGLWVADGGGSQQLKRYDAQGQLLTTLGALGGYTSDPAVSAGKLCFQSRDGGDPLPATAAPLRISAAGGAAAAAAVRGAER
jgi:sugar lactone lactonase YvrE